MEEIGNDIYGDEDVFTSLKNGVADQVFAEDYGCVKGYILNPSGRTARIWSTVFYAAIMVSLLIDPLFFFSPRVNLNSLCVENEVTLDTVVTVLRSLNDIFYWIHIAIQFDMAYVAPSTRLFGRGELVVDRWKITRRYLGGGFWLDFFAALPLPQVLIWWIIPKGSDVVSLRLIIFFQYIYRFYSIYPLSFETLNATGVMMETTWLRAAYDLLLFFVCGHVSGACWFLLTIQRQEQCWKSVCDQEILSCGYKFFDCSSPADPRKDTWLASSNVTTICTGNSEYQFGIYALGVTTGSSSSSFPYKYTYSLWIGMQAICSTGQSLMTSIYVSENIYSIVVGTVGLLLMVLLIAHMQRYIQYMTVRLEEWRLLKRASEDWMHHRKLPPDLKHHVRKNDQYMWLATRGVDEEELLNRFPADLRREIKRYLCLDLVQRVPLFDQLDELTLDAFCERLRSALYTKGTYLVREGDPVNVIFFVIRGQLDSYTTGGGRDGFFNSSLIGQGGFCGEELLTWALDPHSTSDSLPSSTRTIKAITDVEAFCIAAEDLKFVVLQFRIVHNRELKHKLRFYSQQWRTWAACYIQAAWRHFKERKDFSKIHDPDSRSARGTPYADDHHMDIFVPRPGAGIEVYAARVISNMRRENNY